jgi:uncharacterized membrane protein YedE/YeeE
MEAIVARQAPERHSGADRGTLDELFAEIKAVRKSLEEVNGHMHEIETDPSNRRTTAVQAIAPFLPSLRVQLPFWQYAVAIILSATLWSADALPDQPLLSFVPLQGFVPLILGFWIGLRKQGLHWRLYVGAALLVGILSLFIALCFYDLYGLLEFSIDMFQEPLVISSIFFYFPAPTLLFVSGALLGNYVQRKAAQSQVAGYKLPANETDEREAKLQRQVAIWGFAGTVLGSLITVVGTALIQLYIPNGG